LGLDRAMALLPSIKMPKHAAQLTAQAGPFRGFLSRRLSRQVKEANSCNYLCLKHLGTKKRPGSLPGAFTKWSGRRDSNSRRPPWQGGGLPTELLPRERGGVFDSGFARQPDYLLHAFGRARCISSFSPAGCTAHVSPSHDRPCHAFHPRPARFHEPKLGGAAFVRLQRLPSARARARLPAPP